MHGVSSSSQAPQAPLSSLASKSDTIHDTIDDTLHDNTHITPHNTHNAHNALKSHNTPDLTTFLSNFSILTNAAVPKQSVEPSPQAFPAHSIPSNPSDDPDALPPSISLTCPTANVPITTLSGAQSYYETTAYERALSERGLNLSNAFSREDLTSLGPSQAHLVRWFKPLCAAIAKEQQLCHKGVTGTDRSNYGPLLVLLPPQKLAVISTHTALNHILHSGNKTTFTKLCVAVGDAVRAELGVVKVKHENEHGRGTFTDYKMKELLASSGHSANKVRKVNLRASKLLSDADYTWPTHLRAKLGAYLLGAVLSSCVDPHGNPCFMLERHRPTLKKIVGVMSLRGDVFGDLVAGPMGGDVFAVRHLPMVVKPLPWTDPQDGGYLYNRERIMRTHGCTLQTTFLETADMPEVMEGLNCLGETPWRINKEILEVQEEAYRQGLTVGDLPSKVDFPVPTPPDFDGEDTPIGPDGKVDKTSPGYEAFKAKFIKWTREKEAAAKVRQRNAELHSLRCDTTIKLGQAGQFKDYDKIYFPWNVDFR